MFRPKQFARIGIFYLEEAILDVLYDASQKNERLDSTQISGRIGIPHEVAEIIVKAILQKLEKEDRVSPVLLQGQYELRTEEYKERREEL